ncbi:MAG: response regulator transcription factor [Sphingopyxis terrae]|nr:MAG: response regulator transcription factor [Sphingopyxis terrae]
MSQPAQIGSDAPAASGMAARPGILLVDDDVDLREAVSDYLRLAGFDVTGVATAAEFYRKLEGADFELAMIDLGLPDRDGIEIAGFVAERTTMGVIVFTGRRDTASRLSALRAGADLYFTKPVDGVELAAAARNLLRRVRG